MRLTPAFCAATIACALAAYPAFAEEKAKEPPAVLIQATNANRPTTTPSATDAFAARNGDVAAPMPKTPNTPLSAEMFAADSANNMRITEQPKPVRVQPMPNH